MLPLFQEAVSCQVGLPDSLGSGPRGRGWGWGLLLAAALPTPPCPRTFGGIALGKRPKESGGACPVFCQSSWERRGHKVNR